MLGSPPGRGSLPSSSRPAPYTSRIDGPDRESRRLVLLHQRRNLRGIGTRHPLRVDRVPVHPERCHGFRQPLAGPYAVQRGELAAGRDVGEGELVVALRIGVDDVTTAIDPEATRHQAAHVMRGIGFPVVGPDRLESSPVPVERE
jgi:hypothetical protein